MGIEPLSKEATKLVIESAFKSKFNDPELTISRIRGFDLKSPQKSNRYLTTEFNEEMQEWRGLANVGDTPYRFFVRNTGDGDDPIIAHIIDPLSEVFDDPTGRPRVNMNQIDMVWMSKGQTLPITETDEDALDVYKGLLEMGYNDYAETFRTNYLAFKGAEDT
jgi:hypothetical protein